MNNRIFISYRRKGGDVTAKLISETLKNRGYETFYDYDGLKGGPFDQQIRNEILCCTDLVLILPKNALKRCKNKNDWVREEIRIALQHGKNIVPVMLDGFEFPETLPDDIDAVRRYNGVRFQMDYFEAVITKIIDKLSSSTHTAKPSKTTKAPVHSTADSTKRASSVPDAFKPRKSATKRAAAPTVNYESANDGRRTWQSGSDYTIPPLSLLNEIPPIPGISEADAEEIANRILGKLQSFGRSACFAGYSAGPTVTRFEFVPNEGVRINDILSLRDDIAMELGVESVHIQAPLPGKNTFGIDVPNQKRIIAPLRASLEDPRFRSAKSNLTVCLGQNITGNTEVMVIDNMPHVLITGQTKSGKTVTVNTMLLSLLYRVSPDDVKLILIDPKQVEYSIYSNIPHLLMPIIHTASEAMASLEWAVKEMERRYQLMMLHNARNRDDYLKKTESELEREAFPQLLIVIDELADLMLQCGERVETLINSLATKSRAAGIHMIICTQRTSSDVITGLIKANIPARISFKQMSQVDSELVGTPGAERLLGKGDMLYQAPAGARTRIQGAFADQTEITAVVNYVIENNGGAWFEPKILKQLKEEEDLICAKMRADAMSENVDPKLLEAIEIAVYDQKVSITALQIALEIGYNRAARIIEAMEELGVIGPYNGTNPREVYISKDKYNDWLLEQFGYTEENVDEEEGDEEPAAEVDESTTPAKDSFSSLRRVFNTSESEEEEAAAETEPTVAELPSTVSTKRSRLQIICTAFACIFGLVAIALFIFIGGKSWDSITIHFVFLIFQLLIFSLISGIPGGALHFRNTNNRLIICALCFFIPAAVLLILGLIFIDFFLLAVALPYSLLNLLLGVLFLLQYIAGNSRKKRVLHKKNLNKVKHPVFIIVYSAVSIILCGIIYLGLTPFINMIYDSIEARDGDADSQRSLGRFYLEIDDHMAGARWLRESAEQGNIYAAKDLGNYYNQSYWIGDRKKAVDLFMYYYSNYINSDQSIKPKLEAAYTKICPQLLNSESIDLDSLTTEENYYLGTVFHVGIWDYIVEGEKQNAYAASIFYEKAANEGHPSAAYMLGYLYEKGAGVEQDYTKAYNWYTQAKENDYQFNIDDDIGRVAAKLPKS